MNIPIDTHSTQDPIVVQLCVPFSRNSYCQNVHQPIYYNDSSFRTAIDILKGIVYEKKLHRFLQVEFCMLKYCSKFLQSVLLYYS